MTKPLVERDGMKKSLVERVEGIDYLSRQLRKLSSWIRSGENVDAFRECNRLIAELEREKKKMLEENEKENNHG